MKKIDPRFAVLVSAAVLFVLSLGVSSQTISGSLSGVARDQDGTPLAGVQVTLRGPALQGVRAVVTDAEGAFLMANLPPGSGYELTAVAQDLPPLVWSNLAVTAGVVSTLNLTVAERRTDITVSGYNPVSPRQTTIPATLVDTEIEALPVLGEFQDRSYQSLLYFSPSATHSRLAGNPAMAGATGIENVYLMDGLTTNDPVTGSFGTNLNIAFMREMDTETFGVEADLGTSTGGLFNLITRSGGNEFHLDLFGWTTQSAWTARENSNDFEVTEGRNWHAVDWGIDAAGPILKDRLWYFVGVNPYSKTEENEGLDVLRNTRDGRILGVPYDFDRTVDTTTYLGKLTWRASDRHTLEWEVFGDPSQQRQYEGPAPTLYPASRSSRRSVGSLNTGLRWYASLAPRFFLDAHLGFTHRRDDLKPWPSGAAGFGTPLLVSQDWDQDLAVSPGFGKFVFDDRETRQVGLSLTWSPGQSRFGQHELRAGFEFDESDWRQTSDYTGGRFSQLRKQFGPDMTDPADYHNWYVYSLQNPQLHEKGRYAALFLQDRWTPVEDLTFTAGLRWERNRLESGSGNSLALDSLSPRLGVIWDFTGDDRSKLALSYGRYYERVPLYLASVLDAGHASYKDTYVDGALTSHTVYNSRPAFALGGVKNQSQDEWVLSLQHEVSAGVVLGARAVYRDLNRLLETVGYVAGPSGDISLMIMNPGWQNPALLETWRGVVPDYAPFARPVRRYEALELMLEKRFADRWFLHANYTLSRLEGNTAAGYDRGNPELAPNATKEWDIPSAIWERNRFGPLPTDRTHQVKVTGGYRFDNGLLLGGSLRFDTGRPKDKLADWPKNEVGYGKLFVAPRGSSGRLPSALTINLHAEYDVRFGRSTLTAFFDVFNLLNDQASFRIEETYYEKRSYWSDPLVVNPDWGKTKSRTEPRAAAIGLKWSF